MDYYYKELDKLFEEFHEVMRKYPLFKEDIDELEKRDIKEINELLEKSDEFYLKKAISKLKDLINYIKDTSESINKEYSKFDSLASTWEKTIIPFSLNKDIDIINSKVSKANELIKSHKLSDLAEANKIMEELIKMTR